MCFGTREALPRTRDTQSTCSKSAASLVRLREARYDPQEPRAVGEARLERDAFGNNEADHRALSDPAIHFQDRADTRRPFAHALQTEVDLVCAMQGLCWNSSAVVL